jgi:hypothetical protein
MSESATDPRQGDSARIASGNDEPPAEDPLTADEVFHLLQAKRRRLVLHYLRGQDGPVEMREAAEQVAAWEYDTAREALRSQERQRVYIALYQDHLPALDDAGVVDYDKPRGTLEPAGGAQQLYRYLAPRGESAGAGSTGDRAIYDPSAYYGGASLLSVGLFTASSAGLLALSATVVAAITTALFTLVTLGARLGPLWRATAEPAG